MRAAVIHEYGEPSVVRTEDVDDPLVGPDYVLVEVAAAGVNPVDWKVVAGYLRGAFPHHLPLIPGWDVSGVVVGVGPAVTEVEVGDQVSAYARKDHVEHGTFAERVAVHTRAVAKVPDEVDIVDAGALPLAGLTAAQLLGATEVGAHDTVLVHAAAGGVGSFATQLAVARGARVIGTGSSASHDYLRSLGAEPVAYGEGLASRVTELTPGGAQVVIDLIGGEALAATPDLLAPNGRVASIVDADTVRELGGRYVFVRPDASMLGELLQQVARGEVTVHIAERFGLDMAAEALAASKSGHVRGKIVITV
ncbi:MAG: NADP-dependent oxidoreductase [Nocardioidaceae bacterium]|nr:NADP-dependent oxidoreductase [Nocardioidaceae bacterium]